MMPGRAVSVRRFLHFARRMTRVTLVSYSQVLLSGNPRSGLFFLAASFATHPLVGLAGLTATLSANLVGYLTYQERIRWELGLAGYNAVMLGLAIGYFLPNPWWALAVALIAGGFSAAITESIYRRFRHSGMPVLGLPFLLVSWLILATGRGFLPLTGKNVIEFLQLPLHGFLATFLRDMGTVYFSAGLLSGILVLVGLIVSSRISAALGLAGALAGALISLVNPSSISLNINFVILPIGLMFFLAPNRWLPLHILSGMGLTVLAGLGLEPLFHALGFPLLILPLTLVILVFLILGKRRLLGVELVPLLLLHDPESNLRIYRRRLREPLHLPFFGTWTVSQGVKGAETHVGRLAHAWDFLVRDERGRTFDTPGYRLQDYHAYGLLIPASAPGRVVAIEDGVRDNPPAKVNRKENWGNYVIIEHNPLEYSILAHLRQGSIRVGHGDSVAAGTVIGACGNSGYSGQPHVHYQLQTGPIPGCDTIPVRFGNYVVLGPDGERFVRSGIPVQGETLQPVVAREETRDLLTKCFSTSLLLHRGPARTKIMAENWTLRSRFTSVRLRPEPEGIAISSIRGSRTTVLGRMFMGLDFIPFYCHAGLTFSCGTWRHLFGHRERLTFAPRPSPLANLQSSIFNPQSSIPSSLAQMDALILESFGPRIRRRLWLAPELGIARVDWLDGNGGELESWTVEKPGP